MRHLLSWVTFFFLLSVPNSHAAVFHSQSFTLANGMQIVVVPNTLSDALVQMVWYKVGAADDPSGASGVAHYLEHMMFKRTEKLESGEFSAQIAALGGQNNAFTGYDTTAYHVSVSAKHLALVMQMEAERMRSLNPAVAEAVTERNVVLSERQERTENNPIGLFYEKLRTTFFAEHPYGRPVIGWRKEIEKLDLENLKVFYNQFYAPSNAVLVVSGNVNVADVLRLAAGTFGRLAAGEKRTSLSLPPVMKLPAKQSIVMRDARVKQAFWTKQILAPSYREAPQKALATGVLLEILAGGEVGLLYRHFVMDKKSASGIDARFDSDTRGPSVFSLIAVPSLDNDLAVLAKDIEAYLHKLAQKGFSQASVDAAKKRFLDSAVFARDRLMAPAQILGESLAIGLRIEDVESWPSHIRAVTPAQIDAALRSLLAQKHTVSGMLLPEKEGGAL
ncbi:MAG TPA: peptidase M16 [Rhodospirillaceae bacterium]|nr:peptidase M16 [Rhodospirillaceae bacterium]